MESLERSVKDLSRINQSNAEINSLFFEQINEQNL